MKTTKHSWGEWESVGHGGGVVSTRDCRHCHAQQWRDTAASTRTGGTRTATGYRDAYGDDCDGRPDCTGYDPLADQE